MIRGISMKSNKRLLFMAIISFFLLSVSILLMPIASDKAQSGEFRMRYILGGSFWVLILIGYIIIMILHIKAKKTTDTKVNYKTGVFIFFTNRLATIADTSFIISTILLLIARFTIDSSNYIICILFSLLILSFHMHIIFNSKIYNIIISNK